jgi:cellulose synthase operon protein C
MVTIMRIARGAFQPSSIAIACLMLMGQGTVSAQTAAVPTPEQARRILVDKAHTLETRGRPDMALQLWQQILLSDPNNVEALEGVAKDYKLIGQNDKANDALTRLRKVSPNDPNIAKIEALTSTRVENDELRQAGDLAKQNKPDDAMRIYRGLYGDHPPDGDIALAYYETLYATASGKDQAVAAMRALAQRNPGDTRYSIELGRMLTYQQRTRAEGIRVLQEFPKDASAQAALRQALIWDAANPASAPELRQYLKEHPQDTVIAADLKENEEKLSQMNSGIARAPAEREAFAALSAKKIDEAQKLFNQILEGDPKNPRAAAGMGFLRMEQNNFAGAISYLTQAEEGGLKDSTVETALATSRFFFTLGEATLAFNENQLDEAAARYKEALAMRPRSPEALSGLAGLFVKEQQYGKAADVYLELTKVEPGSADAWRGLFLAYAQDGQNQKALAVASGFSAPVKAALDRDPEYLRTLAAVDRAEGRGDDAQRVLAMALALPFPNEGAKLKAETRLQYASILMEANRFDQAAELYTQILNADGANLSAWMGLVSAEHELKRDSDAIAVVERMPPAAYESALADPGFLSMLGSIYQQANQLEIAQGLLERGAKAAIAAGHQPPVNLEMQLAAIYLARNNTAQAYGIYRQVLVAHPERVDAWKGLIATLQATHHTAAALEEIALIPPAVRKRLEQDVEFVQSEASLYAATGDYPHAVENLNRVINYYAALKSAPPSNVEIQNAWLLFNLRNDRALYPALLHLGSRQDLTIAQRETVENIWAQWGVRRAAAAVDDGNSQRGKDILDATFQAFPDNLAVRRAVAGGYLTAGRSKDALAIFKTIPMQDASAADFEGAVGAALAANDLAQAETWLRQALDRYATDPRVLGLAARFEQARGNNQRAAEYWRASLAATPAATPTDKLAHEMAYPDEPAGTKRANTPADLKRLLDPENEPFPHTSRLPPLPAYGPDPYEGAAPVVMNVAPQTIQPMPQTGLQPIPSQPDSWSNTPIATPPPAAPVSMAPEPAAPQMQLSSIPEASEALAPQAAANELPRPAVKPYIPPVSASEASTPEQVPLVANVNAALPADPTQLAQASADDAPVGVSQPTPEEAQAARLHAVIDAAARAPKEPDEVQPAQLNASIETSPVEPLRFDLPSDSATVIRALPNAPVSAPASNATESAPDAIRSTGPEYNVAQYTPSAQEAASGAYSAPKPQPAAQQLTAQPAAQQAAQPAPGQPEKAPAKPHKPIRLKAPATAQSAPAANQPGSQPAPTLGNAPGTAQTALEANPIPEAQPNAPAAQEPMTHAGLTDEELQDRNLPPLTGSWVRIQRQQRPPTPQDEAQTELQSIESGYSPWLGGTGALNYRSGNLGYDHLSALSSPFESSMPFGYNSRLTFVAQPVFLDSGQADGSATLSVQESIAGANALISIPEPLGTDVNTGPTATTTSTTKLNIPAQQNAAGIGGEVQLAFPHGAIAGGYTPAGFLVSNATARANWRPNNGPFTFSFVRDSIKDSQLSYAGLRDPGTASLDHEGQVWGGVMANQGNIQYTRGDAASGYYFGVGGQYISGVNVLNNSRVDGSAGSYWRIYSHPDYGTLSVGANFFAMHYGNNQLAYTFGMGGYFSPQAYFLANVPFTWTAHSGPRWHYNILGSFGVQAFQEDAEPLWPLAQDKALEISQDSAMLPAKTSVGPNYDLRAQTAYAINANWFAGGFLGANNARNYTSASVGFYIRYMFRPQVETVTGPTGIFPADGFRPFRVP